MYGLPKVHKPQPVPLRPTTISMVGSAHHQLAKLLAEILQPVLDHYSTRSVRDSFEFVETIREHQVQGSMFLCFQQRTRMSCL